MGRKSRNKPLKREIRIYCEGETEKIYFDLLKQKYRLPNIKVKTKVAPGQSVDLVHYTLDSLKKLSPSDKKSIDKVLVVFDKDDEPVSTIEKAFEIAHSNNIGICFSNECFEVWLLAHFEEIQKNKVWTRKLLYARLSKILGIESFAVEKANKTLIQKIFTHADDIESNIIHFTNDFKQPNYSDMLKTIKEIFQNNV